MTRKELGALSKFADRQVDQVLPMSERIAFATRVSLLIEDVEQLQRERDEAVTQSKTCLWRWDRKREWWATSCDTGFDIPYDVVIEDDDFAVCPNCAGRIEIQGDRDEEVPG